MPPARPILENRPLFGSCDVDETRAFMRPYGLRFDPVGSAAALDAQFNGVFLPGVYVGYVQFGAGALVHIDPNTAYAIELPLQGGFNTVAGADVIDCNTQRAAVLSPVCENIMESKAGATRLNIVLKRDAVTEQLEALLGNPLKRPLHLAAAVDLQRGYGLSLARFIRLAIAELERPDTILLEPVTAHSFREFLMTALLLHHPHNYSENLRRLRRPVSPRDVKRAIDYIEANLDAAIGLREIIVAAGVPGRTLIQHFRDFKGTSPMRYVRSARYERVREALRRAEPGDSVTEIAANWGFSHLGRFSVEYRKRFGESPSRTLQRRRAVRAADD